MGEKIGLSLACEKGSLGFSLVILTYGTLQRHAHLPRASPLCALNTLAKAGLLPPAGLLAQSFSSLLFAAFGRRRYWQVFAAFAHFFLNVICRTWQSPPCPRTTRGPQFRNMDINCTHLK